jgi:hypothetical protein
MDRQQFTLVARYGDVCDVLKMAINQARKILLPNAQGMAAAACTPKNDQTASSPSP